MVFVPEQMAHKGEKQEAASLKQWRPSLPDAAMLVGKICPNRLPEKHLAFPELCSMEGFPCNSTNSGDKYLTIIPAFFTPKRIFSCGPAVARTLAF